MSQDAPKAGTGFSKSKFVKSLQLLLFLAEETVSLLEKNRLSDPFQEVDERQVSNHCGVGRGAVPPLSRAAEPGLLTPTKTCDC